MVPQRIDTSLATALASHETLLRNANGGDHDSLSRTSMSTLRRRLQGKAEGVRNAAHPLRRSALPPERTSPHQMKQRSWTLPELSDELRLEGINAQVCSTSALKLESMR